MLYISCDLYVLCPGRTSRQLGPVGSYRKIIGFYWIRRRFVRSCQNPISRIPTGSRRTSVSIGMIASPVGTPKFRHFPTSDDFLSESNTEDSDNFRQTPIKSDRVRLTWVCFFISLWLLYIKYMYYVCIFVSVSDESQ